MKKKLGYSWIELIIVLIVIVILTAIAIPKFLDLMADTRIHAIKTLAASLTAANTSNYNLRKANRTKGIAISNCSDVASALQDGKLPVNYTIIAAPVSLNVSASCILKGPKDTTTTFTATGIK